MFGAKPGEVFTAEAPQFGIAVARLDGVHSARPDDIAPLVEQQRQQLTQDLFEQIGNSAEAYARDKVKAKTNLDRARTAIGVDPKEIEAKQTNAPATGNKAP
jgi:peptidyl-prolyl cis-trans isomerase D